MVFIYIIFFLVLLLITARIFIRKIWKIQKGPHKATPSSLGLDFEEVWIPKDGAAPLFAWWINITSNSDKVIIFQHGWGRNAERMLPYINALKDTGAVMIAADFTGHGKSPDEKFPNMYLFSRDIQYIIDYAGKRIGKKVDVTVIGHSIGGGAAVSAAGRDSRITRVITLGAPSHPYDIMKYEFDRRGVPTFLSNLLIRYIEYKIGQKFDTFAPSEVISRSKANMLIVHGSLDKVVPVTQAEQLAARADKSLVQLWVMEGINHSNFIDYPGFARRMNTFVGS